MSVRKIRGVWHADVWIDVPGEGKKRFRRRSPYKTKRESEKFEKEVIEELLSTLMPTQGDDEQSSSLDEATSRQPANSRQRGDRGPREELVKFGKEGVHDEQVTIEKEMRYGKFAVDFLQTYAATNNKYSELMSKESILRVHLVPAFGQLPLSEIKPARIERYKAEKLEAGLKPKTINNTLTVLRKSLVVAQEWGLLETVPSIKWMKAAKPSFDFLDFEEAERLVVAADPDWQPIIILALKTGLRLGELRALRWQDVDLAASRLMVRQAVARGKIGTPKSNRQRWLPLCATAVNALEGHKHRRGELVFCKRSGTMLRKNQTKRPLWRACKRAGLRRIGWHVLRHTFASHLVMTGVPLKAVQELLGHSTIDMTMRYAHLSPDVTREAVARLDGIDGIGRAVVVGGDTWEGNRTGRL